MVSLSGADGTFIAFFDTRGEALMYAALHSVPSPFIITEV